MINSPPGWGFNALALPFQPLTRPEGQVLAPPVVRRINMGDLGSALRLGWQDFAASRTDVIFLCVIYPVIGLLLARIASGYNLLPLLFPLASGFALVGPLAAVGLNEMSRRREQGRSATLADAFHVFRTDAIGGIFVLGIVLMTMFVAWLVLSQVVYALTLGPQAPVSYAAFAHDITSTAPGRAMALWGIGAGFVFAVAAFAISVVSFPLLLDRPVSVDIAVRTSLEAVWRNPLPMAAWAVIIAGSLIVAAVPVLLGLVIVMPVLGHASWHLYRRVVGG